MIYLDYHSTTPCDSRVKEAVTAALDSFGNPSSPHAPGREAEDLLSESRRRVAKLINAFPGEILFTSGATESNNIALQGVGRYIAGKEKTSSKIMVSEVEHKSVINPAKYLQRFGFQVIEIPVNSRGEVDLDFLAEQCGENTALVSVQLANNEIGTIQSLKQISTICNNMDTVLHTDATQAIGKLPVDVNELGVDLMSMSSHKVYGPKGVGALYMKGGVSSQPVEQLMFGGGQESGMRPGTQNVPGICGFGEACRLAEEELLEDAKRLRRLRDLFEAQVQDELPWTEIIATNAQRLPSTSNIRLPGIEADAVLARIRNVALSTGSACESGAPEPSHVLQAIGLTRTEAYECIRLGVGRFTSEEDIGCAVDALVEVVTEIKETVK